MDQKQRLAAIGGVSVAVAALVGFGTYGLINSGDGDGGSDQVTEAGEESPDEAPDGPPSAEEVSTASGAFLDAWAAGDTEAAAELTDDPEAARAALAPLTENEAVAGLTLRAGAADGAEVPFEVAAQVGYGEEQPVELAYASELAVVRDADSGAVVVDWAPTVLHPRLADGQTLAVDARPELPPIEVLAADGSVLTEEEFPGLAPLLDQLRERHLEASGGDPGGAVVIQDAEGEPVETLLELSDPVPGQVPTTLVPELQRAADEAVADTGQGAVVAIQPSTGAIQAVANAEPDGTDIALEGSYAPGSTFKIVTASLLLERGLADPSGPHPCPQYFEHGGWEFQNLDEFEIENGTFADSFAASCNTAFISQAPELADDELGAHARDFFGLGLEWQIGATSMDGRIPVEAQAQMAAQLIGQGAVRMNPLTMASVSATVQNGGFRQPYLVPADFDGRQLATTDGGLPGADQLRSLMNRTATAGTAAEAMAGLSGDIGAKTGSAEVDGQEKPNAWFTGYRGDLAVAAVVPDSGHGGRFAGPVVADVLRAAP
ncbi:penicillin-binding transpeptidase domain-containing protein [Streptomyces sp. DSM 44915]|uniref:Penicillin-binding transpeptidase domain-containing protein n=1 Tax=Streptomyces chisholmiae TaxID=3075540 RepID=A0ABU2JTL0_9ACTN|nr:penicillin-binding transpeptidase domain-containing protein [Streptomyces sp. DSM 44915]MDT0268310.1 penicillin-binding transpeptidase domain-containing protein [Streptomyces sp. DSM 44915]